MIVPVITADIFVSLGRRNSEQITGRYGPQVGLRHGWGAEPPSIFFSFFLGFCLRNKEKWFFFIFPANLWRETEKLRCSCYCSELFLNAGEKGVLKLDSLQIEMLFNKLSCETERLILRLNILRSRFFFLGFLKVNEIVHRYIKILRK